MINIFRDAMDAGGGGTTKVYVDYEGLSGILSLISEDLQTLNSAKTAADAAADAAIAAGGGESTDVGKAIKGALKDTTSTEFGQAVKIIEELQGAISKVQTVYKNENEALVAAINKIALGASAGITSAGALGNENLTLSVK